MADVACVGILVADVVGKPIDRLPAHGTLSLVERMELHPGGCAANTGLALAKLGVDTAILGKVGQDGFGDFLLRRFTECGIDTRGLARDASCATSATMVLVHSDGERSFLHYFGANAAYSLDDVDFSCVLASKIVHLAGALVMPSLDGAPAAELLRRARDGGAITALDTVWDATGRWMERLAPALPYVDYMLPNLEEARMLAGGREDPADIASYLLDLGPRVVALKMGAQGAYVRTRDGDELRVPAYEVAAVDALGAGDAWVAGFLAGLNAGWDLLHCAELGNAVGACCVQALGATTGVLSLTDTQDFMTRTPLTTVSAP